MGSFSIWHWIVVLIVVVVVFGSGKLRNMGSDLGASIRGFKQGLKDGDDAQNLEKEIQDAATAETTTTAKEKV